MRPLEQDAEATLVQRLYAREEAAMTHFYTNYRKALYMPIWRLVRHTQVAEDILQESMLRFWVAFPTYTSEKGRLFTWALQIGRNLAIDHLRKQRQDVQYHAEEVTRQSNLAARVTFYPEHIGVCDWLKLLSTSENELAELLYVQGYSQAEAADELQLPLGTVKSRSRRVIRLLASRMRD